MSDNFGRILEHSQQGFCCSQILLIMGLEELGQANVDLVRTMGGLCGGVGASGNNCGALTGGVCLLSLYVGRGSDEEQEVRFAGAMIAEFVQWFQERYGSVYGGVDCAKILENDPMNKFERCPEIVYAVYEKVSEIMEEYGYSMKQEKGGI